MIMVLGPHKKKAEAKAEVKAEKESWVQRLREGLAYVRRRVALQRLLAIQAFAFVFFTLVLPIEIVYAKESLDAGDSGYGILLSAWGIGMVVGSLFFIATARRATLPSQLLLSTALIGCAYIGMALAGSLGAACAAAAAGGVGNGIQWVSVMSGVQELTSQKYQARVVGLLESIGMLMPGIGFILGGVIAEVLDPRASFFAAGAGVLLVVAVASLLLRGIDWTPEGEVAAGVDGAPVGELGGS